MTEQEAKKMWCPFARVSGVRVGQRCLASGCMAWRKGFDPSDNGDTGYCGLVGKPELHHRERLNNEEAA